MRSVTRSVLPISGVFVMAVALGVAHADPAPPTATGAQSGAITVAPATVVQNPQDKVICRMEIPTGSRLGGHRVCMRKSDWDAQTQDARHKIEFAPPSSTAPGR